MRVPKKFRNLYFEKGQITGGGRESIHEHTTPNGHIGFKCLYIPISIGKITNSSNPSAILMVIFVMIRFFFGYFLQRD